jgi:hypothetical protein
MVTNYDDLLATYFSFLVDDYGLIRDNNSFCSKSIKLTITFDRHHPICEISLFNEPEYVSLSLGWIISYFTNSKFDSSDYFPSFDIEKNSKIYSDLLKAYANNIIFNYDNWWVSAIKNKIKVFEEDLGFSPIPSLRELYEYVEERGER